MKKMNAAKYRAYQGVDLPDRQWPNKLIVQAPIWCSVDLRDGNQAISVPMSVEKKIKMFELLVAVGFKEIEVGFPSASQTEYDFVRKLIEENKIPADVTIQVLTQAREHLIKRSFEALTGVKKAIVHMYNSTSTLQREVVFRMGKKEIKAIALEAAEIMQSLKDSQVGSDIAFQYSPESFTGTELDYALEVCHEVLNVWKPTADKKVIVNLPATVEMAPPNVYADQIEWFGRQVNNRDSIIISVHPHNDRGCAVAAGELAIMAGADRVEGTLFGNGERTGNLDVITMAMNMFSSGVDPNLDFSDMDHLREVYTECTLMNVHARHPYAGELVYTAFSGSHQDAINKGIKAYKQNKKEIWEVPYLPIDPADVGRSYESIIRINSQSGKGGVAYILETEFGFKLPKAMQAEFALIIQQITDKTGKELAPAMIRQKFEETYLQINKPYELKKCRFLLDSDLASGNMAKVDAILKVENQERPVCGQGNGPIDAFVHALANNLELHVSVDTYFEHAINEGSDAMAAAYINISMENESCFGVGVDTNIDMASVKAILSALNRLWVIQH